MFTGLQATGAESNLKAVASMAPSTLMGTVPECRSEAHSGADGAASGQRGNGKSDQDTQLVQG